MNSDTFRNPPPEFREIPFWSWNDLLERDENLLGPHHLAGGDPNRTNPEEFRDKTRWTDDYILTPFGWEQVRLCW